MITEKNIPTVGGYDVAVCGGGIAGIAAAMCDDFTALDVCALQKKLQKCGVVLHETDLKE